MAVLVVVPWDLETYVNGWFGDSCFLVGHEDTKAELSEEVVDEVVNVLFWAHLDIIITAFGYVGGRGVLRVISRRVL